MKPNHAPLDTRGIERAREKAAKAERVSRDTEEDDIKWMMGSRRGRRVIWRLLEHAGVYRSTFNTNAMAMSFAEGNRNGGLRMMQMIHSLCPELYPTMVKENTNEHRSNDDGNRNDN